MDGGGGGGGVNVVGFSSSVAAPVKGKFKINNLPAETDETGICICYTLSPCI